jgi:alpha-L-fucosidase
MHTTAIVTALVASATGFTDGKSVNAPPTEPPTWETLGEREVPEWFGDAKFGIFIHWGVYSVPSFCDTSTYSEWYQWWYDTNSHGGKVRDFHHANYGEEFAYEEFAPMFQAEMFDPAEWASIFRRAGAKYMVITSKHHDGFCLWDSKVASEARGYPWNAVEVGPKRDLLADLFEACREEGVAPGLYYSFMEWHNPLYDNDKPRYVDEVMIPQIKDLITRYKPVVFWPDGEWNHPDSLWRSREILDWIYANSPDQTIVTNDRWGKGLRGQVGDFSTTEYGNLGNSSGEGMRATRPFEECRGIGHSFAFNRAENYDIYASRSKCIHQLIDLVSKGGNLLLDIGPTADGRIPLIMVDRLLAIGDWLEVNGEAIYGTTAGPFGDLLPWGRSTRNGNTVYLHILEWPEDDAIGLPMLATPIVRATMLGDRKPGRVLNIDGTTIDLSDQHPNEHANVIKLELAGPPVLDSSIHADSKGQVVLGAADATIVGGTLRTETKSEGIVNLGYWTTTDSTATWEARLTPGKSYDIVIDYACPANATGGVLSVRVNTTTLNWTINEPTSSWAQFKTKSIGSVTAAGDGPATVEVRATKVGPPALINLRSISLVPSKK